jgi:hypothetical protein
MTADSVYLELPSITGDLLLHSQFEDVPYCADKGAACGYTSTHNIIESNKNNFGNVCYIAYISSRCLSLMLLAFAATVPHKWQL